MVELKYDIVNQNAEDIEQVILSGWTATSPFCVPSKHFIRQQTSLSRMLVNETEIELACLTKQLQFYGW